MKTPARMGRHLKAHGELSPSLRKEAERKAKRYDVVHQLDKLRVSNPSVAVVCRLSDEEEPGDVMPASEVRGDPARPQMKALTAAVVWCSI